MTEQWSQENSQVYRQLAAVAVPARAEQIATLLTLMPFGKQDHFRVVELASGEGLLSEAILRAFPNATLLALDFEESMRLTTATRLGEYGARASVGAFDMHATDWYTHLEGVDVVVSSLCIHHLDGDEKQAMFQAIAQRLSARGALLIADIVLPVRNGAREVFAATWDRSAQVQAGDSTLFNLFLSEKWNYFRYPDPFDKPSPLFDQLLWLKNAGFAVVDCFWMQAGHAIYGGYKAADDGNSIGFDAALMVAQDTLTL